MRKSLLAVTASVLAIAVFACGTVSAAQPELTIKVAHVIAAGTPLDKMGYKFAELVKEKSGGKIVAEVYANSSLGGNREICEQLQLGSLEIAVTSVAFVGGFTKATMILDLPYLFESNEAAEAVLDGEVGDWIWSELRKQGFVGLGYAAQGWRHVTSSREVDGPEDMKGLKIRVMENPLHIAHFNALGASAIPMAFSEVFTALQQGAIDAQENPWCNIDMSRFYEVQKYIVKTAHLYDPCPVMYSELLWDKLTPEQQKIIQEAATEAIAYERELCYQDEEDTEKKIAALGTNVIVQLPPEKRAEFRKAAQPVYDMYREQIGGDLIEKVMQIQASMK